MNAHYPTLNGETVRRRCIDASGLPGQIRFALYRPRLLLSSLWGSDLVISPQGFVCGLRSRHVALGTLALLLFGVGLAPAGLAPEETALVVNAESWLSRSVANEYASLRGIPSANIIQMEGIPSHEGIPVSQFRELILQPLLVTLERRRLAPHVSCIVYSADFPTWVDVSDDVGSRRLPDVVGSRASLTGLTYLYQGVLARNLDYLDPISNWYARRLRQATALGRVWKEDETSAYREVEAFFAEKQKRQAPGAAAGDQAAWVSAEWEKALPRLEKVAAAHAENAAVVYNLACARAQTGHLDEAMATLRAAVGAGFTDVRHIQKDEDLTPLRGRADFLALVEELRGWQADMVPPCAFSAGVGWTPQGVPVPPYKGARYLLSTMLGVGSGRGNSFDEIITGLRRSLAADGSRPAGTVYFMLNDDVRSTAREWAVRGAAAAVRAAGVQAEVLSGVLPEGKADVAGAFVGAAGFDWKASGSTILPGAICEHLTSFGGMLDESAGQTPLSEFMRHGAAGACGTVCEPFAIQAKFPHAFVQAYYTAGYTLAESFYLSVTGPYQLLMVGDALCAPWAQRPAVTLAGMQPGQRADGVQQVRCEAAPGGAVIAEVTWFVDGQRIALLGPAQALELDCSKLASGWHVVSAAAGLAGTVQARRRAEIPFVTRGQPADFELVSIPAAPVPWGSMVTVTRKAHAGQRLALLWQSEEVATLEPEDDEIKIRADQLAIGRVELRPVISGAAAGGALSGAPVVVTIERPAASGKLPAGLVALMPEGLALTVRGTPTVAERAAGDWLEKAGVAEGNSVMIEGWFELPEAALGQFQFSGNLPLDGSAVSVDDVSYTVPAGSGWRSFPVSLAAGTHSLVVRTTGREHPRLDIRFGVRGTAVLTGKSFRHR